MKFYDAHNHLQDERFGGRQAELMAVALRENVAGMVVNGACEEDWPAVLALARQYPTVLPSFGYHPWYLHERTPQWRECLVECLDQIPSAVGEIGLDRWKPDLPYEGQEEAFLWQLQLAAERNLPVSIHCLQAWGRLYDLLRTQPLPAVGFLLHSYGGPKEMVPGFVKLGAYFSFPGYFAHERKQRQREAFRAVPPDRFLIETDAPDQLPPPAWNRHLLTDASGRERNHPANLSAIYAYAAQWLDQPLEKLAAQTEENFRRLFGAVWKK